MAAVALIVNADKDVVVGFYIGALIAPILNNLVDRRPDRTDSVHYEQD